MHTRASLLAYLADLGITTETTDHTAVYTVDEAKAHRGTMVGAHSKNLFLKDKKGALFLVTALEDAAIDLKDLRSILGCKPLSFASAERLQQHLGVSPGAVTPFAVINDGVGVVTMVLDRRLLDFDRLNFHPLENTATTAISPNGLRRFLEETGHPPATIDFSSGTAL